MLKLKEDKPLDDKQDAKLDAAPLVSVIMAVYNSADTLGAALDSIASQTYSNWELAACDDGSTDGTAAVLREFQARLGTERMILLRNETNRKLAYSLNRCLSATSGEYVARMDADDLSEPSRFATQLRYLQDNPDVDLVGTAMQRFNESGLGDIIQTRNARPNRSTMATSPTAFFHATILARRHVFDQVGGYTVSWRTERGQDLDLWYKFFAANLVGHNLSEPLYRMRDTERSVLRRTRKARFGTFVTRVVGNHSLGLSWQANLRAFAGLQKVLVPMGLLELRRRWIWKDTRDPNPLPSRGAEVKPDKRQGES